MIEFIITSMVNLVLGGVITYCFQKHKERKGKKSQRTEVAIAIKHNIKNIIKVAASLPHNLNLMLTSNPWYNHTEKTRENTENLNRNIDELAKHWNHLLSIDDVTLDVQNKINSAIDRSNEHKVQQIFIKSLSTMVHNRDARNSALSSSQQTITAGNSAIQALNSIYLKEGTGYHSQKKASK